tara:strand:- start:86 stop:445 length:360 start_codon:yes stop_codon:yes gene_type:complete
MKFEVCDNVEWYKTFSQAGTKVVEAVNETEIEEAIDFLVSCIWGSLQSSFPDAVIESPKAERTFCHGWNGANTFTYKIGPVGTFDDLNEEQQDKVHDAIETAVKETVTDWRIIDKELKQ